MATRAYAMNESRTLPNSTRVPGILRHLIDLSGSFATDTDRITYIHIYARPPAGDDQEEWRPIRAAESGPEGIACVDDVARAAILALQAYRQLRVPAARELGRTWLGFLTHMQDSDGRFTNFIIDRAGRRNRRGRTSYPGGPWWTARALWALAVGFRVTGDEQYLHMLERAHPTRTTNLKVTAIRAMALMEWYECRPTDALQRRIFHLCDRLVAAGPDYFRDRKGRDELYPWGYHQLQAVARAGRVFSRIDYLTACEHTVDNAVKPLIAGGFGEIAPWRQAPRCVYDVSTLMLGLEELYTATGHERYRDLALACVDWLYGANPAGEALYDPRTGRCGDGVTESGVSANCGAESTIEAGFMELARRRLQSGESSRVQPRSK
ncbi:MAG: hypothetical protein ACRDIE_24855 [Chloroflexota bacterium]